ncbi:serine/threonine protein kinase [Inhella gelatinilytica]|uniref:HDOD domain-containing protein n=1 Tax=Inhella gelatinilytica TaxID=2795030 RepID=A0A931IYR1_9BURK|nr:serine/threonine protein kinase [Inhella gelatinilytica]MBH9553455.1 HDOD domain-containing protein [Inhella gelatinilytica]
MATLGRFKLVRKLGEGAQATVWLAHDPRLDREVALKVLTAEDADVNTWLHEGRAVSRLNHPGIVPVFEADRFDGQPALVFELVRGGTLTRLMSEGPQAPRRAVELMIQILDALACAHAAGVVHRDLKPGNVLLDPQQHPRVTDFGIAARATDHSEARIVGTPGYISPEAARGEAPQPRMDVYAAAMMLAELLSGRRINGDSNAMRSLRRTLDEDFELPEVKHADMDDALRAIVQRGMARDPSKRWDSAAAMRDALTHWLHVPQEDQGEGDKEAGAAALEFLLRRMRAKADFPGLSASIERIQRLAHSETESLSGFANEILKDVALTQKLLRLVNTAQFRHAGGGNISTVSRAVALVGFGGVRSLALSLVLLERMENRAHAAQLKTEFVRSLMAGSLARELMDRPREAEEMFVVALFQNLGRMLTEFYFPEEAQQVRRTVRDAQGTQAPVSEATASTRALGISYEELGAAVAKRWGMPDGLTQAMRKPNGEPPDRPLEVPVERQRWMGRLANDAADTMLHTEPERVQSKLAQLAESSSKALRLSGKVFEEACGQAKQRLADLVEVMELRIDKRAPEQRLIAPPPVEAADGSGMAAAEMATLVMDTKVIHEEPANAREKAAQHLAAGIQDITDAMVESNDLGSVLRMILETMYRALDLRRVLFVLRDARTDTLVGRFGMGEGIESLTPQFKVPLKPAPGLAPDLFAAVCLKGVDTLISDTTHGTVAQRLPEWWRRQFAAGSFLVLPLMVKGAPFAMIYADRAQAGSIELDEKELSLLRTLRNQAVMAFRQAGGA